MMTIEKAVEELKKEYEIVKAQEWIQNPVAYSLYQIWKVADRDCKRKKEKEK